MAFENNAITKLNMRNLDLLSEVISLENLGSVLVCLKLMKGGDKFNSIH